MSGSLVVKKLAAPSAGGRSSSKGYQDARRGSLQDALAAVKAEEALAAVQAEEATWAEEAKGLFIKYDANGDGCMDEDELGALLMAMSDKFTKDDIRRMLREADTNGNGRVEFSEFIDWVTGSTTESLGRAVVENTKGLELLFTVYDRDRTTTITARQFEECHVILQSAVRLVNVYDEDDHKNADLEHDKEEALDFIAKKAVSGQIGFLDFVDWMKQHIPPGMDQDDFYDYAQTLAKRLEECFDHDFSTEEGYIKEKVVSSHLAERFSTSRQRAGLATRRKSQRKASPWDDLPEGLSIDRLKATHMMVMPLNMRAVKDLSWEVLCLPSGDAGSEVWIAEVVRRVVLVATRKLKVEDAQYYMYDTDLGEWVQCDASHQDIFSTIVAGLGLFCLLKAAGNFGSLLHWADVQHALEGGVDMRFINEDDVETFNEHISELVLEQMEEDGIKSGDSREAKLKFVQRYLANELEIHPGMVMATLLNLEIVERDPAWEDFVDG